MLIFRVESDFPGNISKNAHFVFLYTLWGQKGKKIVSGTFETGTVAIRVV